MSVKTITPQAVTFLRLSCICLAVLFLTGCSFVNILNVSDTKVYVSVRVPDNGRGYTRIIPPGMQTSVFSGHGGGYSVTVLPNKEYEGFLRDLQSLISKRLFKERATLSAAEVTRLVNRLNEANVFLAELAEPGASCRGSLPDFETTTAIVAFDLTANSYVVNCN